MKTVPHTVEPRHLEVLYPKGFRLTKKKYSRPTAKAPPAKRVKRKAAKKKGIKSPVKKIKRQSLPRHRRVHIKKIFSR